MVETWWTNAVEHPWAFIVLFGGYALWRIIKWLGVHLFSDKTGIIPAHVRQIGEDSRSMKEAIVEVAKSNSDSLTVFRNTINDSLRDNRIAIESLERQLVSAIQARPDDEELFEILFHKNPIAICFSDADRKFIRANLACEELWGYSAGELSALSFEDITHESDIAADIENLQLLQAGSTKRYRMEKIYVKKDGAQQKCALYVFRYPSTGSFIHFISIIIPL